MNWYKTSQVKSAPTITVISLAIMMAKIHDIKDMNIISIRDATGTKNIPFYKYIDNLRPPNMLVMTFDDVWDTDQRNMFPTEVYPEESHVSEILEWSKRKWEENHKDFYVHCTAGISRSSAVATVLNTMFQNKTVALSRIDLARHYPNPRILEIGERLIGSPGLSDEVKGMLDAYDKEHPYEGF